jgi:uncharacterized membrane protein YccF (DUF307 family)
MKAALCLAGTYGFIALSLFLVYASLLEWKYKISVHVLSVQGVPTPTWVEKQTVHPKLEIRVHYFPSGSAAVQSVQDALTVEYAGDNKSFVNAEFDKMKWFPYSILSIADDTNQYPFDCSFCISELVQDELVVGEFNVTEVVHQILSSVAKNRTDNSKPALIQRDVNLTSSDSGLAVTYGLKFNPMLTYLGYDMDWSGGALLPIAILAKFILVTVIAVLDVRDQPLASTLSKRAFMIGSLNALWMMIGGLELASLYLVFMMLCCFSILALPLADRLLGLMSYLMLPFGRRLIMLPRWELFLDPDAWSTRALEFGWRVLGAVPLALVHAILGIATIIIFPIGREHFKIAVALFSMFHLEVEYECEEMEAKLLLYKKNSSMDDRQRFDRFLSRVSPSLSRFDDHEPAA